MNHDRWGRQAKLTSMTVVSVPSSAQPRYRPAPPHRRRVAVAAASIVSLAMALAACTDSGVNTDAFCATAQANADGLVGNITDAAERAATIERFTVLQEQAPKVIEDDLATMLRVFEALGKLDLTDPEERNEAFGLAASQELMQASSNVETYVNDRCKVSLVPQTTVVGGTVVGGTVVGGTVDATTTVAASTTTEN